jgi:hypothetical protein
MNPALENVSMTLGKPVGAFPGQDHMAHIQTHLDFGTDPMLGGNPIMSSMFLPAMVNHVKEHLSFWYLDQMKRGSKLNILKVERIPIIEQATLAATSVNVKQLSQQELAAVMKDLMPLKQQVDQMMEQQRAHQIPIDPNAQAIVNAQMAETQRKAQQDQIKSTLDAKKLQIDTQQDNAHEMTEQQMEAARLQTQVAINDANNIAQERMKGMELSIDAARLDAEQQRTIVEEEQMLHKMENPKPETKESK